MTMWVRALWAEALKLKRSLAFWLVVIAPLVVVFLQFVLILDRGADLLGKPGAPWMQFGVQPISLWCLLMLPLFITLETALTAGLEHSGHNWQRLFVMPVPRGAVYAAKLAVDLALIGLSMLALVAEIGLAGLLLHALRPDLGLGTVVPWLALLRFAGAAYLSSWLLIAVHAWVGMRWKNFVVAMSFGIAMTIAGVIVINSRWAGFYPWTMPALVVFTMREGGSTALKLGLGAGGGVVAAFLGGWMFTRRDVL